MMYYPQPSHFGIENDRLIISSYKIRWYPIIRTCLIIQYLPYLTKDVWEPSEGLETNQQQLKLKVLLNSDPVATSPLNKSESYYLTQKAQGPTGINKLKFYSKRPDAKGSLPNPQIVGKMFKLKHYVIFSILLKLLEIHS